MIFINLNKKKYKVCTKCGQVKDIGEFYKDKSKKSGCYSNCKECIKQYYQKNSDKIIERHRLYNQKNSQKRKEYQRQYRQKNFDKIKEQKKQYREENIEKIKKQKRQYRQENFEKIKMKEKQYHEKNKDKIKEKGKQYYQENSDKIKETNRKYRQTEIARAARNEKRKNREKLDPSYRLRRNMSKYICSFLKLKGNLKNGFSTFKHLSYSLFELKEHLESQFEPWMNWDNWGRTKLDGIKRWQIDHIIPHSSFEYYNMDCEEFRKCWALENLRPLEAFENIKKGNKI